MRDAIQRDTGDSMKLASVSLRNFRSYLDRVTVKIDDFTTVMGRNDVGKSTVLEALEIFFNQQVVKLDQADPCVHGADKVVEISCIFDEFPNGLTLDEQSQTSLEAEYLLNCEGLLEIVKRFDCKGAKPKEEIFARALHPSAAELADLLQLKNTALKERAASVGADLTGVDKLLDERLIFRDLVDFVVADQIRAAVADLNQIDRAGRDADARKSRAHALKLRVGASLLMDQIISVDRRVVKSADQRFVVSVGRNGFVGIGVEKFLADRFNRHFARDLAGQRAAHSV